MTEKKINKIFSKINSFKMVLQYEIKILFLFENKFKLKRFSFNFLKINNIIFDSQVQCRVLLRQQFIVLTSLRSNLKGRRSMSNRFHIFSFKNFFLFHLLPDMFRKNKRIKSTFFLIGLGFVRRQFIIYQKKNSIFHWFRSNNFENKIYVIFFFSFFVWNESFSFWRKY